MADLFGTTKRSIHAVLEWLANIILPMKDGKFLKKIQLVIYLTTSCILNNLYL